MLPFRISQGCAAACLLLALAVTTPPSSAPLMGHANRLVLGLNPSYGLTRGDGFVNIPNSRALGGRTDTDRQAASDFVAYGENMLGLTTRLTLVAGAPAFVAARNNRDDFVEPGQSNGRYPREQLAEQFVALTAETADKTFIDFANSVSASGHCTFGMKAGGALRTTLSGFAEARKLANKKTRPAPVSFATPWAATSRSFCAVLAAACMRG